MPRHHPWRHRRREFLGACCANACDWAECYGSGCYGQTCGQSGGQYTSPLPGTVMQQNPPQDANSTVTQTNQTGQPPAPPPPTSSGFSLANLTNFQTPTPYIAIGGVILLAALLTGGGRKSGAAATPNIFHYG